MDQKILREVEKTLANASIASVRSWFKGKGKKFSAGSREKMVARVASLIEKSDITFSEIEDAMVGIEEAGGKYIRLFHYTEECSESNVSDQLKRLGIPTSSSRKLAKASPSKPTLIYAALTGQVLRVKWCETHQKPTMDFENDKVEYADVTKVIVLVANLKTKQVEIRYDRPETFHPHSKVARSKDSYFAFYVKLAETILCVKLQRSELQKPIKSLVDGKPSLVRLHRDGHTNENNDHFTSVARKGGDIRDDDEYQAMHAKGGGAWAYEEQSFYWRPETSGGRLTREVYSHVDALDSSLRVDADCWDAEVDYAVQKIRELQ